MDALIGLGWPLSFGSSSLVFARFGVCPFLGVENLVLSLQDSRGVADALGAPLTYRLQGQNPSTSSGSSWSACARDSSSWSRPSPASRHPPPRRAVRGAPPSLRSPTSARLLLSTDVSRSTVAVPRNESLTASDLVRTSAASGTGKPSVPTHAAAPRLGNPPPSPPRRRRQSPRGPATADGPHPMPGGSRRPRRIPCRTPAPL